MTAPVGDRPTASGRGDSDTVTGTKSDSDVEMIEVNKRDSVIEVKEIDSEMSSHVQTDVDSDHGDPVNDAHEKVKELLHELQEGWKPCNNTFSTESDIILDQLNYKDLPKLRQACTALTVKSKDKRLDILFRGQLTGMVGVLNLYLDSQLSYTWCEASLIASKAQGHGVAHARNLRMWIHSFLGSGKLPLHQYGRLHSTILEDEDFAHEIQIHLSGIAKNNYIQAQDIVDFMETPEMQEKLDEIGVGKKKISLCTAQCWLHRMGWRYGRKRNGMYVDGHERDDVVAY